MDGQPFGEEFDWPALAAGAGAVGRFIWYLDQGDCELDNTLMKMTMMDDRAGRFPADEFIARIHTEDQPQVWLAVNEALVTGGPYQVEFRFIRPNGKTVWLAAQGSIADLPMGGKALLGVNYDITEQRTLQERHELVAGEMAHRVKNLLMTVGSIYRSTASIASSVEDLSASFLPRLQALAALNGLAARSGHKEIQLEALVETVLQPIAGRNVTRDLAPVYVNGTAGQMLALVLNELMTNSLKHGGLASNSGHVKIEILDDDDLFTLIWSEKAAYEVSPPVNPSGFGMQVLNNMTAATFQGRPQFNWRKEGLRFHCEWPLDKICED